MRFHHSYLYFGLPKFTSFFLRHWDRSESHVLTLISYFIYIIAFSFIWYMLYETGTKADQHEFVSASIHFFFCAYIRPAWLRLGCWTEMRNSLTSLSLYQFHVNDNKSYTRSRNFMPVCFWASDMFIRQKIYIISSWNQSPSISSWVHVNSCKSFIVVQVHTGLGLSRSHVNTPLEPFKEIKDYFITTAVAYYDQISRRKQHPIFQCFCKFY